MELKMNKDKILAVRISAEELERLKKLAAELDIPIGQLVRSALKKIK